MPTEGRRPCTSDTSPSGPTRTPIPGYFGATGKPIMDLTVSNEIYDSKLGAELYNRYLDEKLYAEEMGFGRPHAQRAPRHPLLHGRRHERREASILARITKRAKIVLLGNIIPIWDDPLWLVEQLSMIDMISRGRLVSGWVRGTGRESVAHNAPPPYNWERFQEAHEFIVKAWTTPALPLGGQALPVPPRQPLGASLPEAPPPGLAPRRHQPRLPDVGRREAHPLHHALHRAGADQERLQALPRHRRRTRLRVRPPRTSATSGRSTLTRPRNWPSRPDASSSRGLATLPRRQRRHHQPGDGLSAGPDLPPPCPAHPGQRHRRPRRPRPASWAGLTSSRLPTTPSSPARPRPSSPRSATSSSTCARQRLLLGWRRRNDPRRRHAQPPPHGRRGHPRRQGDRQGTGTPQLLRGRPCHRQALPRRNPRHPGHS